MAALAAAGGGAAAEAGVPAEAPPQIRTALEKAASHSDPAECLEGLRTLSKLIFNNVPMKVWVARAGAVQTCTSAMKRFRSEAALQTQGCKVLRQLAFRAPENTAKIVGSGALAVIAVAMRTHETDEPLLTEALWALLLLGSEGDEHVTVIDRLTRPSVEAALKKYPSNQMLASKAQFLLAMFDRIPESIVEQPFIHNVPPTPAESNMHPEPGSVPVEVLQMTAELQPGELEPEKSPPAGTGASFDH